MNRKLINVFFVAALFVGGASVFSSCKDTSEDLRTELMSQNAQTQKDLGDKLSALADRVSTLEGYDIPGMKGDIKDLKDGIKDLQDALDDLEMPTVPTEELLKALYDKTAALEDRANSTVTSLLIQGTHNPVSGYFALPWNIRSNMLLTYYGQMGDVEFPKAGSADNIGDYLTEDDLAATGVEVETINGEVSAVNPETGEENYLGKVYVTVNPNFVSPVDNENLVLSLETSQENNYGDVELTDWAQSEEELMFGVSRADNGFYEATAIAGDLDALKIDVSGIGSAFKDVLKDRSKAQLKNLAQLLISKIQQNEFPAYGIKAEYSWNTPTFDIVKDEEANTWTVENYVDNPGSAAVYSQYEIAMSAMEPLSFAFLDGVGLDKLPSLPDADKLLNFDLANYFSFEIKAPNITTSKVTVTVSDVEVKVVIDPIEVKDEHGNVIGKTEKQIIVSSADLSSLQANLEKALNDAMGNVDNVKDAITDMVNDINSQIKNAFQTVNDKVHALGKKIQPWIDRAQSIIDRVNDILKDPNHYLQVCLLYDNGDGIHRVSTSSAIPTAFPGVDEDGEIALVATTYTAEIVVPSYKKFIAVTKAWNNGVALDAAAVKAINQENGFDQVQAGSESVFFFKPQPGYKYEIAYQALDYQGVTSTRKFYVELGNE